MSVEDYCPEVHNDPRFEDVMKYQRKEKNMIVKDLNHLKVKSSKN